MNSDVRLRVPVLVPNNLGSWTVEVNSVLIVGIGKQVKLHVDFGSQCGDPTILDPGLLL